NSRIKDFLPLPNYRPPKFSVDEDNPNASSSGVTNLDLRNYRVKSPTATPEEKVAPQNDIPSVTRGNTRFEQRQASVRRDRSRYLYKSLHDLTQNVERMTLFAGLSKEKSVVDMCKDNCASHHQQITKIIAKFPNPKKRQERDSSDEETT